MHSNTLSYLSFHFELWYTLRNYLTERWRKSIFGVQNCFCLKLENMYSSYIVWVIKSGISSIVFVTLKSAYLLFFFLIVHTSFLKNLILNWDINLRRYWRFLFICKGIFKLFLSFRNIFLTFESFWHKILTISLQS